MRSCIPGLLIITGLLTACARDTQTTAPRSSRPLDYEAHMTDGGYIYVLRYFTRAEVRDPAIEARRRASIGSNVKVCRGDKEIVRRDVRWFPATAMSGQACATIFYTLHCTGEAAPGLEAMRRYDLKQPPPSPPLKGCAAR